LVNDYDFEPDGDVDEGKAAAAELVGYFKAEVSEVQLSLWLEDRDNPLHHYHITVFDSMEALERVPKNLFAGAAYPLRKNEILGASLTLRHSLC
jgi:hypothetical protein